MNTAEILKSLREQHGLSQQDVADKLNIDRTTYVKYESGSSKPVRKLAEIASLFNVSTDYILGTEEPKKKIPKDLKKLLDEEEITLNGRMVSPEDKEKMLRIIEALYYDAKEENKRKS